MKAKVNLLNYSISFAKVSNHLKSEKLNYTIGGKGFEQQIKNLMKQNYQNEILPFTTTIQAEIRTATNEPVWVRQYPYPYSDHEFVKKEIQKLLENNIIQPSKSPYNSPIWTVSKKGTTEDGQPKRRMVIDFQKLNKQTIADRYPIPDITMTFQNLGKASYFTTLDLESGFHQIMIKPEDREKTAFLVNGAKYEFLRLPFGLKNAPSTFQRCVDDILRPFIGICAYVYIDDVLIYSTTPEQHVKDITNIVQTLHRANMKISEEKSNFFQKQTEFLGHIIKNGRITVDPKKIEVIDRYKEPTNLKELRSFLGLASYYRKFVKNFAQICKPLTIYLRGENGNISKNKSSTVKIKLDEEALKAVETLKNKLKEQIELYQPDFNLGFDLTTDASNYAIGAVLSQGKNPIAFISRTLSQTEQNYSTNEKEMLAIVWSLQKLRNYLYGIADLTIYTDHQSLIFSISEKNPNAKLKRWKNQIEEYGATLKYKPGHENIVADALSRQIFNSSNESVHSAESSEVRNIRQVTAPLNSFKTQVILEKGDDNQLVTSTIFPKHERFIITFKDTKFLLTTIKAVIKPKIMTAFHSELKLWHDIQPLLKATFEAYPKVFAQIKLNDIIIDKEKEEIANFTHKRAHRNARNNLKEIMETCYWPTIKKDTERIVKNCIICTENKYERKPIKHLIGKTPTPELAGTSIQMDIFYIQNEKYLSSIDRYSKYTYIRKLDTKRHFHEILEEVITQIFPFCSELMTDNENIFIGIGTTALLNRLQIKHTRTPNNHSTSNAQVERHNKNRQQKTYTPGQIIYEKSSRRDKYTKRYIQHQVKEDREDTILTTRGKIIHKDNIRQNVQTTDTPMHDADHEGTGANRPKK